MALKRYFSERPLRLPRLRPYVPQPDDPPIYWFNSERDDIIREVTDRVVASKATSSGALEFALNDAAMHEVRRLTAQRDEESDEHLGFWRGVMRGVGKMSDGDKRETLRQVAGHMARDVAGNFDPRVYDLARRGGPHIVTGIMQPSRLPGGLTSGVTALDDLLKVEGDTEKLERLQEIGTLVYVPTHSSNLDSIVLAQAIEKSGLSPVVYGAGKNLFTNPIISFGMHNLGAYRVDRRIRAAVYKDVLKTYAGVMVERGYHSLFFPGGTRTRSGMIERRLKLGLMGSAVEAFSQNQVRGVARRVFFVPTTINYALVLEAETLVEDWLKEAGQARYIIEDDEFSRIDRWVDFFRRLRETRAACVVRFADALDAYGNPVDGEGNSLSPGGRVIDPGGYVERDGEPVLDVARDKAYTRELGEVLADHYHSNTVLMSTNLVAHVLYRHLVRESAGLDLFSRLRLHGVTMPRAQARDELAALRERARGLMADGVVRMSALCMTADPDTLIDRALRVWNGYHHRTAAEDLGAHLSAEDPMLLVYYQNRVVPFAVRLAEGTDAATQAASCDIARLGDGR